MKPEFVNKIFNNKKIYNYVNKLYKKGIIYGEVNKIHEEEEKKDANNIPVVINEKANRKRKKLKEEFENLDQALAREFALILLNSGLTFSDAHVGTLSVENEGVKSFYQLVENTIMQDEDLHKMSDKNNELIDSRINKLDEEKDYPAKLQEIFGDKADNVTNDLKQVIKNVRGKYIVAEGQRKASVDSVLEAKQHYLSEFIINLKADFSKYNDATLNKIDKFINKVTNDYIFASLSFTEKEIELAKQHDKNYPTPKLGTIQFIANEKFGIRNFINEYSTIKLNTIEKNQLEDSINNFYKSLDNKKDSKEQFDSFMKVMAENLFNLGFYQSKYINEKVNNLNGLINVYNSMAESKGIKEIKKEQLNDKDIKEYLYNLFGSGQVVDNFKTFMEYDGENYKGYGGYVDTNAAKFENNMEAFDQHMNELKEQSDKTSKTYSIDMEVYRKNYNTLKQLHESRGFLFKIFHGSTYRNETARLKQYIPQFLEAFNIVGAENESTVTKMITGTTPLVRTDGTNIRFLSNENFIANNVTKDRLNEFTEKFKNTELDDELDLTGDKIINKEDAADNRVAMEVNEINNNQPKVEGMAEKDPEDLQINDEIQPLI